MYHCPPGPFSQFRGMSRKFVSGMIRPRSERGHVYIDTYEQLVEFCDHAAHAHVLAVDTEFLRERTYHPQLCLVQLGTHDSIAAVDPLAIEDLSPVRALFEDARITKVFHSCSQDMEVIDCTLGCVPAPIFDTQVAAAFLGQRLQLGYGALVEKYEGVHLPKASSLTDWSKRPLDEEQLSYAEDDVRYLPHIYDAMMAELIARDRLGWVEPEFQRLCERSRYETDPDEAYLRLKRSSGLSPRQLAVAREVCAWRERKAMRRNIPRKWVVSDEVLAEACRLAPKSVERLRRIRGAAQLSDRDAEGLVLAVKRGLDCPKDQQPQPVRHVRHAADSESVVDLMYALVRLVSEKSGVAVQLIASKDDLLTFLTDRDESHLAHGWRYELVGADLDRLLCGEMGLTVKDSHIEVL